MIDAVYYLPVFPPLFIEIAQNTVPPIVQSVYLPEKNFALQ